MRPTAVGWPPKTCDHAVANRNEHLTLALCDKQREKGKRKSGRGRGSEERRAPGLAAARAAPPFPANAGNEEIGSHQNIQALSHLSKRPRATRRGLCKINLLPDGTILWRFIEKWVLTVSKTMYRWIIRE